MIFIIKKKDFMVPEIARDDKIYNANLIILQEFIKATNFKERMFIPKFFIK
jgi:hypothetical protein